MAIDAQAREHELPLLPLSTLLLLAFAGCAATSHPAALSPATAAPTPAQADFTERSRQLEHYFLERNTVSPPSVSFTPQTRVDGGITITVAPERPESEAWNSWPDGTARLFNDAIGYLWRVKVVSDRPVKWSPPQTRLAVNDTEQTFEPASEPDDVLVFLQDSALQETRLGVPANLSLRLRNADDFRKDYLGRDVLTGTRDGVLLFPAPAGQLQAVAMELTLALSIEGEGVRQYKFLFE